MSSEPSVMRLNMGFVNIEWNPELRICETTTAENVSVQRTGNLIRITDSLGYEGNVRLEPTGFTILGNEELAELERNEKAAREIREFASDEEDEPETKKRKITFEDVRQTNDTLENLLSIITDMDKRIESKFESIQQTMNELDLAQRPHEQVALSDNIACQVPTQAQEKEQGSADSEINGALEDFFTAEELADLLGPY